VCDLVQLPFRILFSAKPKTENRSIHHLKVAKRSAKFYEDTELHKIEQLKSDSLRNSKYLIKNGNRISFFGQAWSNTSADWIYFDTILDFDRLRKKFKLMDNIVLHENLDPKSGTEKDL
jgi:hypothetical protein